MKYEISIEGGFTGIPKEYSGEIELQDTTKKSLVTAFEREPTPKNTELRDGLQYHLKLLDGEKTYDVVFDETNLPLPIRQFIATISKKK